MEKLLRTKRDKEQFMTWLTFLWAGIFRKGKGSLETESSTYCCLGIACMLTIPEENIRRRKFTNAISGGFPNSQPAPEWLKKINNNYRDRHGKTISQLNDTNWSHKRIADSLYETYKHELEDGNN